MLELYKNKEFLRLSIFLMWLINMSGFFGILSSERQFYLNATPYVLSLTFLLIILNHNLKKINTLLAIFLIFFLGILVEIFGVNFSLFFGQYSYGDSLGLKIFNVPVVIGFNWVLLVIITGSFIEKYVKSKIYIKIILSSILMVLLDILIEKVAPVLDFWKFNLDPVPNSNYLWWFIFSLFFHIIYFQLIEKKEKTLSINILIIQFLFFGLLTVFI
tara:strand:+ start:962 stop:1609 length:648 start_codon:yes stop_codon:yes gene_type:complete